MSLAQWSVDPADAVDTSLTADAHSTRFAPREDAFDASIEVYSLNYSTNGPLPGNRSLLDQGGSRARHPADARSAVLVCFEAGHLNALLLWHAR
jgi:hypothetical protein